MRRLLFVALRLPVSSYSGNALILRNYLSYLGRRHEVDLVATGTDQERGNVALARWCQRVVAVGSPSWADRRLAMVRGLFTGLPRGVSRYGNVELQRAVDQLVAERRYDAVIVQLLEAAQFRPTAFTGVTILDLEDPPAEKMRRTLPWFSWRGRIAARLDIGRVRRYERACVKAFDRLVFVNPHDALEFGDRYHADEKVSCIPHAVEAVESHAPESARVDNLIVMTGNMAHPPNVAAARFIWRDVFPRVRQAIPLAQLWIVGSAPTPEVLRWGKTAGIRVTGVVPDVRAYLAQARVAVCGVPVKIGAQTKVLEALACGTPVVTTTAGNYGVRGIHREHLYVADDPAEFAGYITSLLRRERWAQMSESGRRLVETRFGAARAGADMERLIEATISVDG